MKRLSNFFFKKMALFWINTVGVIDQTFKNYTETQDIT